MKRVFETAEREEVKILRNSVFLVQRYVVDCVTEHVQDPGLRDVTASERDGHWTGVRGRSSFFRARQSLGAARCLSHSQY